MPSQTNIIQLGNPVLRKKAKVVENISQAKVQKLIDELLALIIKVNGVGISAPQISVSSRIFILASHPNPRYPNAPDMKPTPIINPKIISRSKDKNKDWEGCLSIPGIRGLIPRHNAIIVEYQDKKGKKIKRKFENFIARIFQHEYDHLEGIVFLDRLEDNKDIITDLEYQKIIAKKEKKYVRRHLEGEIVK